MDRNRKIVEADKVSMIYHTLEEETYALKEVSFDVYDGEFLTILGPSGSGKSTMLSIISGLLTPSGGTVKVAGKLVDGPNDNVAYMFQRDHLFDWRTIEQNVLLGLEIRKRCTKESKDYAKMFVNTNMVSILPRHFTHSKAIFKTNPCQKSYKKWEKKDSINHNIFARFMSYRIHIYSINKIAICQNSAQKHKRKTQ